jgi:hypothetical protein
MDVTVSALLCWSCNLLFMHSGAQWKWQHVKKT